MVLLLFQGCTSMANPLNPSIDFTEDEVLLSKIKSKYEKKEVNNIDNSLYSENSVDLISNFKVKLKVGDVVFIEIEQKIKRKSLGVKNSSQTNSINLKPASMPDLPLFTTLVAPYMNFQNENSNNFQGSMDVSNEESFKTSINAIVTRKVTDNLYFIEARKEILLANEKQLVKMSGYVHTRNVDNTYKILANKIVDLKIVYENEGSGEDALNKGFIGRIFDKVFF